MSKCSETNPELWELFLVVFKNILGYDFEGDLFESECQEFIDDIGDTCR
jgi:hypothetical protein